jgi:hypothetical protein
MAAPLVASPAETVGTSALPRPVPVRELLPWVLFAGVLLVLALYFIGVEQGALSIFGGHWVHEFVHDARHILAFPCH